MKQHKTRHQIAYEKLRDETVTILVTCYDFTQDFAIEWCDKLRKDFRQTGTPKSPELFAKKIMQIQKNIDESNREYELKKRTKEMQAQFQDKYIKAVSLKIIASNRVGITSSGNHVKIAEDILNCHISVSDTFGHYTRFLESESVRLHDVAVAAGFENEVKQIIDLLKSQYEQKPKRVLGWVA